MISKCLRTDWENKTGK